MEICTQPLTADLMRAELPQIMAWFRDRGFGSLEAMFGVGCAPHISPWERVPVSLEELPEFIEKSGLNRAFEYADADLYICAGRYLTVHLCHEADIHVSTDDLELVAIIKSHWLGKGWTVHEIEPRL